MEALYETLNAIEAGGAVVYPLFALAIVALAITLDKIYIYSKYMKLPNQIDNLIETFGFDWDELTRELTSLGPKNYFSRFLLTIISNRDKPFWWVESRANDEAQLIESAINKSLWVLETIVTAAPLLGLLGTITGMMHSFKLFGGSGLVDPTGVTGGVAQALIATAIGLLIAVVALFAFNYFSRKQAQSLDEMERLGTRLMDNVRLSQEAVK